MYKDSTLQDIGNKPKRADRLYRLGTKTAKYVARPSGTYVADSEQKVGLNNEIFKNKKNSINFERQSSTQLKIYKEWRSDIDKQRNQSQYSVKRSFFNNYGSSFASKSSMISNMNVYDHVSSNNDKISCLSNYSHQNSKKSIYTKKSTNKKAKASRKTENKRIESKSKIRGYNPKHSNQSGQKQSNQTFQTMTTETIIELGSNNNQAKMPKEMKYIEQKNIPTDMTLKCDQYMDTIMQSTSQKIGKQSNHMSGRKSGRTSDLNKDHTMTKQGDNSKDNKVSEFQIRTQFEDPYQINSKLPFHGSKFEQIQETDPVKEDTKSNDQTNEFEEADVEDFDILMCQEEFPSLVKVPSLQDYSEDLAIEQQYSHVVADEEIATSGRRHEVYKSQITLMSLKDINYKQQQCALQMQESAQISQKIEFNENLENLENLDDPDDHEDLTNLENLCGTQENNQVAAEGHARDAAYFSRDQNCPSMKSQSSNQNFRKNSNHESQVSRDDNDSFNYMSNPKENTIQVTKESIIKKCNVVSDRQKIEKLKSPRPEKTFKAEWEQLIDDALNNELGALQDDDLPFEPQKNHTQFDIDQPLTVDVKVKQNSQYSKTDQTSCNQYQKSIYVNSQKANSLKGNEKYQVFSGSEGLTDHSSSPLKSPDLVSQLLNNGKAYTSNHLQITQHRHKNRETKKHYYDPHEPHSALNIPKQTNSIILPSLSKQQDEISRNQIEDSISNHVSNSLLLNNGETQNVGDEQNEGTQYGSLNRKSHIYQDMTEIIETNDNQAQNMQSPRDQVSYKSDCDIIQSSRSTSDRKREGDSFILDHKQNEAIKVHDFISKVSLSNEKDISPQTNNKMDLEAEPELLYQQHQSSGQGLIEDIIDRPYEDMVHNNINLQNSQENQVASTEFDLNPTSQFNINQKDNYDQAYNQKSRHEEIDLVDDGFFENLMKKAPASRNQNLAQGQLEIDDLALNYGEDDTEGFKIETKHINSSGGDNLKTFDFFNEDYFTSNKVNLKEQICNEVQQTYFPQSKRKMEIFHSMLQLEAKIQMVDQQYQLNNQNKSIFEVQTELTPQMRIILLEWMCQVSSDYCLKRKTFHLAILYVDSYLTRYGQHIYTDEFQLIGVTCLHIAAKIEEIYPPHINAFVESTNNSVTQQQMLNLEFKIGSIFNWNFCQFMTFYDWSTWYMQQWDLYVDNSLSYLKQQFHLKFYDNTYKGLQKYQTVMQFTDAVSIDYGSKQFSQRELVASIMYLILGGKDIMCAFQFDYKQMSQVFQKQLPIQYPLNGPFNQMQQDQPRLPEGILFYNQIIEPFFINEFCFYLHDLVRPLQHVLQFFELEISEIVNCAPTQLVNQCQLVIKQYDNIVLEKFYQFRNDGVYPNLYISSEPRNFSEEDIFQNHFQELLSFQNFNHNLLETLKNTESYRNNEVKTEQIISLLPQSTNNQESTNKQQEATTSIKIESYIEPFTIGTTSQVDNKFSTQNMNSPVVNSCSNDYGEPLKDEAHNLNGEESDIIDSQIINAYSVPQSHKQSTQNSIDKGTFISLNIHHRSSQMQSKNDGSQQSIYQNSEDQLY